MTKYLCDEMCAELGHWLRAAGYDTTIVINGGADDDKIFQQAVNERRLLITKDRDFKKIDPEGNVVIYLKGETLDEWADELRLKGVDWLSQPFTRCLQCNSSFQKIEDKWNCPQCNHLYWLGSHTENMEKQLRDWAKVLFLGLGGDLMIGRLVNDYLDEAPPSYIWGDLLPILKSNDFNLVNLEAALTRSEKIAPKVFNFKADPEKVAVLKEGEIHAVNLANNHILDFSEEGLLETIEVLDKTGILHVGAGVDLKSAQAPVILEKRGIKIGILGCTDNEPGWLATSNKPGTNFLDVGDLSITKDVESLRKKVDILILSIHWGPNMRQRPTQKFQDFAHALIDLGVDIIHGHSAHIFQGVEIYKDKLILYDTGDLVDDYAIDPYLRNDQSFYFIVKVSKDGTLDLKMIPTIISHFQVNISQDADQIEKMKTLSREFGEIRIWK